MLDSFWIGVERVIKEKDKSNSVFLNEILYFTDDVLWTPHSDSTTPVDGSGAEITVKRASTAGHHVCSRKFPVSGNLEKEVVLFERNEI